MQIILPYLILTFFLLFLDFYTFQALKTIINLKYFKIIYWIIDLGIIALILFLVQQANRNEGYRSLMILAGIIMALYLPKLLILIPLLIEDIVRISGFIYHKINSSSESSIPSRRKFISQLALGIAAIPFLSVIYGIFIGKYNYRVIRLDLEIEDLPDAFENFTITQISDVHSGSFKNKEEIEYAIDLINEQKSDIIVFTGDLVNSKAEEMQPFLSTFQKLKAKEGMYSILGNHDYGEYAYGNNLEKLKDNRSKLMAIHQEIGFDLLLNEHRRIFRGKEHINIIGVENWGASQHFPKAGNLRLATDGIPANDFNVLLSHDPSHFDFKEMEYNKRASSYPKPNLEETNIISFAKKIQLTLSGHTHGMQFGIEIPSLNIKWSPVKYRYKNWAGLYESNKRLLYVNRGFGYLAFPGRVGMDPEITVINLKKKKS